MRKENYVFGRKKCNFDKNNNLHRNPTANRFFLLISIHSSHILIHQQIFTKRYGENSIKKLRILNELSLNAIHNPAKAYDSEGFVKRHVYIRQVVFF
jgi:hypothetical protein